MRLEQYPQARICFAILISTTPWTSWKEHVARLSSKEYLKDPDHNPWSRMKALVCYRRAVSPNECWICPLLSRDFRALYRRGMIEKVSGLKNKACSLGAQITMVGSNIRTISYQPGPSVAQVLSFAGNKSYGITRVELKGWLSLVKTAKSILFSLSGLCLLMLSMP